MKTFGCDKIMMNDRSNEIEKQRNCLIQGGGAGQIKKQHQRGKLTARERVNKLFDPGTFREVDLWIKPLKTGFDVDQREAPGDGVVTGFGKVAGRLMYAYAHDYTVLGGAMSIGQIHKVTRVMEKALEARVPCIGLIDSGGIKIQDWFGRPGLKPILSGGLGVGFTSGVFPAPAISSGVIPQISLMLGPCYAGSAYSPTMADFVVMRRGTSFMSVAPPSLLKTVTFADVTQEEIGGAEFHATVTGTADYLADTDEDAIEFCRELLSYLPSNNGEKAPAVRTKGGIKQPDESIAHVVSPDLAKPYDMHEIIRRIVDNGRFLEIQSLFARHLIIGFARLAGQTIGIVANNKMVLDGILNLDSCDKQARFIRFCDAFNIPLVTLVDTPGFQSNIDEERSGNGLIRTAAKPVFAICEATVPMIVVYIGQCEGPARMVMGTQRMGIDFAYCWPTAQVARMDLEEATMRILHGGADSEDGPAEGKVHEDFKQKYFRYPFNAGEQLLANDIIDPKDTRPMIIDALELLANKNTLPRPGKKHSLVPQ
ncbi:acyl-CoA carboxylase subunit beta [Chloroflexota bacterium]